MIHLFILYTTNWDGPALLSLVNQVENQSVVELLLNYSHSSVQCTAPPCETSWYGKFMLCCSLQISLTSIPLKPSPTNLIFTFVLISTRGREFQSGPVQHPGLLPEVSCSPPVQHPGRPLKVIWLSGHLPLNPSSRPLPLLGFPDRSGATSRICSLKGTFRLWMLFSVHCPPVHQMSLHFSNHCLPFTCASLSQSFCKLSVLK